MNQYNLSDKDVREFIRKQLINHYNRLREGKSPPLIILLIGQQKRGLSISELMDKEGEYRLLGEAFLKEIWPKVLH